MKERPILFNAPMVRAILEGRKTMTRRVVQPQFNVLHQIRYDCAILTNRIFRNGDGWIKCPYGQPGDRLWVRETWQDTSKDDPSHPVVYRATWKDDEPPESGWKPSIYMPRWASRITLEITSIRVERVQDITEEDSKAEGLFVNPAHKHADLWTWDGVAGNSTNPVYAYQLLWDSINSKRGFGWDANPYVWAIGFRRVK